MKSPQDERLRTMAQGLDDAFDRPLTHPGSSAVARQVLSQFPAADDVLSAFAEKALETLEDGRRHDRMAISPDEPRVAVDFVAWSGSHREVQAIRYGEYLGVLSSMAYRLVEGGIALAGFLEIDAYLQNSAQGLEVDVEYSFLPGPLLRYPEDLSNPFPKALLLNSDLCTEEEVQRLRGAIA
jgi:hypothetical protein